MANEEHKFLAQFLKDVHLSLRKSTRKLGSERAWKEHCEKEDVLITYAQYMEKLAKTHWEVNCNDENSKASSRIKWAADFCNEYFVKNFYVKYREKEKEVADKLNINLVEKECFSKPPRLIDVGSCYNPFKIYEFLDVTAIDLCPANDTVMQCDFLNVDIGLDIKKSDHRVVQLQKGYYDIVTFCFVLEYIPDSKLRIKACETAYTILKPGGLLIIITPDSKHVGANCKIMKTWRYTLALIGFNRIKYEKFRHMHCMAFRKNLCKETAIRWAHLNKKPELNNLIEIPQDKKWEEDEKHNQYLFSNIVTSFEDFEELPFCETLDY